MKDVRFEVEGESVAGALHEPAGTPRGQLVLVHGLLSQRTEFADAPERLAARGWRTLVFDQRGFGASGGERGIVTVQRATADVAGAVDHLRAERPDLPIGLVGHSMGAVYVLGALARDPSIGAAVLAAPMRTVRSEIGSLEFLGYRAGHAVSRLKQRLGLGPLVVPYKNRYQDLFHDEAAAARAEKVAFLTPTVSLANYESLLEMDAEALAADVTQPVLVMLAQYDRAVQNASSRSVYHALAGPKELASYACGHSVWGDCEADAVVEDVDRWMTRHLADAGKR